MSNEHTEQSERAELSFEQIEDCFPEGSGCNEYGQCVVSAQWLHDFARNIQKAAALLSADKAGGEVVDWRDGVNVARLRAALTRMGISTEPSEEGMSADLENWVNALTRSVTHPQPQPSALPDDVVKDREDFARHIAEESPLGSDDWACSRCHPNSDMLKPGFVCVVHRAIDAAMLKEGK